MSEESKTEQPKKPAKKPRAAKPAKPAKPTDKPTDESDRLLEFMGDVPFTLSVEMGRTRMSLRDVMALREGAVVELDRSEQEPLDILANDRLIAKGEIVALGDRIGIRITALLDREGKTH